MATAVPTLPFGLKPPQSLKTDGNLATKWNRGIILRQEGFKKKFQTAMFLTVIREDVLEMYNGMDFIPEYSAR